MIAVIRTCALAGVICTGRADEGELQPHSSADEGTRSLFMDLPVSP
jgi:hypothetical protein